MHSKQPQSETAPRAILRLPEVERRTGRKRSSIYADPSFPACIPLGPRAVGWLESDINEWIEGRIAARRQVRA